MTRSLRRGRGPSATLAGAAALALLATTACAQPGGANGAAEGSAVSSIPLDSVGARAERSRIKGAEDAPVTLVEISDFQCPFCAQFAQQTWPQLDSAYVQTGKVRVVFIHYPLPMHQQAWAASEAATCAGVQDPGKFWEMHDRIFATQREWSGQADAVARFSGFAREMGLDIEEYRACTRNDLVSSVIVNDVMQASGAGVRGTPTFILNGQKMLNGAVPFEQMQQEIDALLAAAPAGPAAAPGAAAPTPPAGQ